MPLIKSKSKKAFSHNIEAEMKSGKPQKQSIAIAYSVKRKAKKASGGSVVSGSPDMNYAKGGMVNESAKSEHRPMPSERDNDSKMISRNSGNKPPHDDSWSSRPDKVSLKGRTYSLKHPKMVPQDGYSVRLRNEEDDLQESARVNNGPQRQPPEHDNEIGPDRQGPEVPDMEREHNNRRKPYAKGGMINEEVSFKDAEEDRVEHPSGLEEDDDQMRPPKDEYMAGHFAKGGRIEDDEMDATASFPASRIDGGFGKVIVKARGGEISPEDEIEEDHDASIASAIMAKRRRMAEGGDIKSHDSIYSDDSDQADLSRNADEDANEEDQLSFNALRKENYSESPGLHQLDVPLDSNEDDREIESDKHDMVSSIRRKMRSRR